MNEIAALHNLSCVFSAVEKKRMGNEPAPGLYRVAHRAQRLADVLCRGGEQRCRPRALPAARGKVFRPTWRFLSSQRRARNYWPKSGCFFCLSVHYICQDSGRTSGMAPYTVVQQPQAVCCSWRWCLCLCCPTFDF